MPEHTIVEPIEELVTINGAAARSGFGRARITNAVLHGALRAVRSGDRILIPADALDRYVAEQRARRSA